LKDPDGNKWRADRLFLHQRRDLREVETWKWLIEEAAPPHSEYTHFLWRACWGGYLDVVKYLVEELGCDPHSGEESILQEACRTGHLDIVKYLIEVQGCDPHSGGNFP
jgi:hypothetical protein